MKLVFEVKSVRQDKNGAIVLLEEPKDTVSQETLYELQELAIYPDDEAEIRKWVSRIGKKVYLTVEDL